MLFLVICILLLLIYLAQKAASLAKDHAAEAALLETELKQIKAAQELPPAPMAYGWFDDGWPLTKVDEEGRAPIGNPAPHRFSDDYSTHMYISEYKSIPSAYQRKEFLRRLFKEGVWKKPELLDQIYGDENAFVRAWAAGHLETNFKDYTDPGDPREIRDYEPALLQDQAPIVRAALWSNPKCNRLPWSLHILISEGWKEQVQGMSQLERLGLMRNPELSDRYVVALLETPSEELNMSRAEHASVLRAAAVNPNVIGRSRAFGREAWRGVHGDVFMPFEDCGRMWKLSIEKWMDESIVPYFFLAYIQTTPEVKLAVYMSLLENSDYKWLRQEVIRSCDPLVDRPVLKFAWDDPDEGCRGTARERVGRFASVVGVIERKPG